MQQNVFIFIAYGYFRLHKHYIKALGEMYIKYQTKTFFFCEVIQDSDISKIKPLEKLGIHIISYKDTTHLENMIRATSVSEDYNIVYIDTLQEDLVYFTHTMKNQYVQSLSYDMGLFSSKEKQRYYIEKNAPEIAVKWQQVDIQKCDYEDLKNHLGLPFLVKPNKDSGSSRVSLIHSKSDLEIYKTLPGEKCDFIAEEFLEGELCNIDYFVDGQGNISYTFPYATYTAKKIGVDDFFVYSWGPKDNMQEVVDFQILQNFIQKTVTASNIKNSFVCHEFIVDVKTQKIRTVELNGRIGMGTILFLEHGYNINPYSFLFHQRNSIEATQKKYFHYYRIFPKESGVLKSFNHTLIEKFKKLPSCIFTEIAPERYEGKKIGLSKDGFWRVGLIAFAHENKEQFKKDCDFFEKNYYDILIMQTNHE